METKITAKHTQPNVFLKDKVRYFTYAIAYTSKNYSLIVNKPTNAFSYIINSMCQYYF